jgi:hypothetical protein
VQRGTHDHHESAAGHDEEEEPPASFSDAVTQIVSLRDEVKAAFSEDDLKEADHAVHEIGHVFEHVVALAKKEDLSEQHQKQASDAVDQLFESFGPVDDKLHGKEGKTYADVEQQVDSAIATLQSLVPKQEN